MSQRVYVSDCEGPISKNDNAFELTSKFIPDGDKLFPVVSKYDDVLADVVKKPGYKAGNTLKLILPFFKAFGVTDEMMEDYSSKNILLVPEAGNTIKTISEIMPTFIVSTSYEHYIRSLCGKIDFPFENTYSTRLNIDNYEIGEYEKNKLEEIAREVVAMPIMEIPESNSFKDFSSVDKSNIMRLDKIFWKEIPQMKIGKILEEVNPIGGFEKANAVDDIVRKLDTKLSEVMYVGDSITDVQAFQKVRNAGGLTVSFNGNDYAVREAEIGITAHTAAVMTVLADTFFEEGKEEVMNSVKFFPDRILIINSENRKQFAEYSGKFRKNVRGEAIGKLG